MAIMKNWRCGKCNSGLKLIPDTDGIGETYICELGHLNFKEKEDEKNN